MKKLQVTTKKSSVLLPTEFIERKIYFIHGHKVMLDSDLAKMYGVSVKRLNEAVKRNRKRFPADFMFQLSIKESQNLLNARSQIVTLEKEIPRSKIAMLNLRSQFATSSYGEEGPYPTSSPSKVSPCSRVSSVATALSRSTSLSCVCLSTSVS